MRFRRNPLLHVLVIVIVVAVAIFGIKSNQIGSRLHRRSPTPSGPPVTPAPVAEQSSLLTQARTLRLQGRYADAVSLLRSVTVVQEAANASAALLETAKDQIALGETADAANALKHIREKYPTTPAADEAQFQLSQVEASQRKWSQAIADLQAYGKRHPEIGSYVNLLLAQYEQDRGKQSEALALATDVANSSAIPRTRVAALETMRAIEKKQNHDAAYLKSTNELLSLASIESYRAELTYERAGSELRLGQRDAALGDLKTIVQQFPDSGYAINAINDLDKLVGTSVVSQQQRGLIDYYRGDYSSALQIFAAELSAHPGNDAAWYYRAMARLKNGDGWTAAVELAAMANRFPNSSLTPTGLYTAGRLYEENNDLTAARNTYQALIQRAPHSVESTNGRLRLGFVLFEQGDFTGAINALAPVHGDGPSQAQASYWEGKAYTKLGQVDQAKRAWTNAAEADPTGFYGLRAGQVLAGTGPTAVAVDSPSLDLPLSTSQQKQVDDWFTSQDTSLASATSAVESDAGYQRMTLLYQLGLNADADWEMSALADQLSNSPAQLAAMGKLLDESGHYNEAYRVGLRLQVVADNSGTHLPDGLQRQAYPLAYPQLVEEQAAARKIDPLLFLALVRQESSYDPTVTSSANARGLAQVVPSTGAQIASSLGVQGWTADDLYRPVIGVEFGTVFLADRINKYGGQIYPALAGYNAGDGNVANWTSKTGIGDPDVFVERIPFAETHTYVKIVYANYLNYLRLYRP